jgi:pimeloyl-ACP methyl ester carboxylesterase
VVAAARDGGVVTDQRQVTVWDPPLQTTVFEAGSGDPVVYLHAGGGVTADDPLVEALAERFHVVAPVHPGFVDPDEVEEIRDVHDLALYHDELFEALGLDAVAVIGHSFGGMVAAELAAHVPHRVSKLVLAAPVGLWNDDYPMADMFTAFPFEINDLLWADPSSGEAQQAMATMAKEFSELKVDDPMVAMLQRVLPGLITIGKYMWPLPDKGLSRRLRRIKAPTLVVWGEKDKLNPSRYADDFVAGIPDARTAFIPEAGHMLPFERTEEFVRLVDEFFS